MYFSFFGSGAKVGSWLLGFTITVLSELGINYIGSEFDIAFENSGFENIFILL